MINRKSEHDKLHRLIIENQSIDGSIDISDQGAMADEILELVNEARIEEIKFALSRTSMEELEERYKELTNDSNKT